MQALLALRVFVANPGSLMFRTHFKCLAVDGQGEGRVVAAAPAGDGDWGGHVLVSSLAASVARQLEVLVTDGSVRISTFSTMTRAIDQALQALQQAQRVDDELDLIRVYIAARDALLAGNFNPCVGILFAYRSVASSSPTSAGRNTVQESVTRLRATVQLLRYREAFEPVRWNASLSWSI